MTATVPVEGARPDVFLRAAGAEPRGFWARGDRWVAHSGALATLQPEAAEGAGARFSRVADAAKAWARGASEVFPSGTDQRVAGKVRFFGGFSFREDHQPAGLWEAFPPALFVLPALELEGDAGGARLTARVLVPPATRAEAVLPVLEDALRRVGDGLRNGRQGRDGPESGVPAQRTELGRVTWEDAVQEALLAIQEGRFSKVVLARTLDVTTAEPLDPVDVVLHLWRQNPGTHVFLFEPRAGRPLLGAAPETIATLRRGVFHATAVAGSIARGESEQEQRSLAERLLGSDKDRQEHAISLQDMVARLGPLAEQVWAEEEPHVLTLSGIQHLETEIRARAPGRSVLELLAALHPTPAVCGLPRDAALEFLRGEEPFERGWYSGPVGFFEGDGNGVFAPALRTAVGHGRTWRLFAGAGIVAGSRPDLEWDETSIKFEPVLRALTASGARVDRPSMGADVATSSTP